VNIYPVSWRSNYWVYISRAAARKQVATEEQGNGIWKVFCRNVFLGYFNENDIREKKNAIRLLAILV